MKYINRKGEVYDGDVDIHVVRHTTSHIMAQAIKRLFPNAKLAIGPAIDNGFYYDIDVEPKLESEDLERIEAEMKKIIKENLVIDAFELPRDEAIKLMKDRNEPYKVELIEDLPDGEEISFFKQGEFVDLCVGPHLRYTKGVKVFKLLNITGAYWRGDEHNKMLQRIYGTAFATKEELDNFLKEEEEKKERDHRKLGKDLGIFMLSDLVGRGLPMYLPKGATIRRLLDRYITDKELENGYLHVCTPVIGSVNLYKTSGHWDHYKDDMFPQMSLDDEAYVLRPMNCPHHMMIYKNSLHSYRDLPIRIAEIANDYRYEASGSVKGLERARCFTQNDSHIFCTQDQVASEFKGVLDLIMEVYKDFNIKDFTCRLSLRDPSDDNDKYFKDDEMWDKAENDLRNVLNELHVDYYEAPGEAAFYGPKLDVLIKPAVGAEVAISTIQLDFLLPRRFELTYVDENGDKQVPVVIHRAILGSLDRFIAFILEETKGALPFWLSPVQVKILTIADRHIEYAKEVEKALRKAKIRVELDSRAEKIGYKIREAQLEKVPYMLVIGDKEVEERNVSVRSRDNGENKTMPYNEFVKEAVEENMTLSEKEE